MSNVTISLKGMNPLSSTTEDMEKILNSLKYLLPPESDIKISVNKYPKSFEGTIVVRSVLGDFTAQESHKEVLGLTKALRDTLKHQIFKFRETKGKWRKAV